MSTRTKYEQLAKNVIQRARRRGAQQAEVYLELGRQSSCRVRDGEIQDLTEATSKGLGLRVVCNQRLGFAFTSDFDPTGLNQFADRAVDLASAAAPHRLNGLPNAEDLGTPSDVGELYDPKVASLQPDWKIKAALEMERAGKAAERAVRMLGAKKVKSQRAPVILDPTMAASFAATIASAANGDAVHKKSSFFAGKLAKRIASASLTLVDDGLRRRGLGTSPFDGEGVATRRTAVIEKGVLGSFLYDCFTARKAKTRTTGNAARSYRSLPAIGTNNLYLEPGSLGPEEIIRE